MTFYLTWNWLLKSSADEQSLNKQIRSHTLYPKSVHVSAKKCPSLVQEVENEQFPLGRLLFIGFTYPCFGVPNCLGRRMSDIGWSAACWLFILWSRPSFVFNFQVRINTGKNTTLKFSEKKEEAKRKRKNSNGNGHGHATPELPNIKTPADIYRWVIYSFSAWAFRLAGDLSVKPSLLLPERNTWNWIYCLKMKVCGFCMVVRP